VERAEDLAGRYVDPGWALSGNEKCAGQLGCVVVRRHSVPVSVRGDLGLLPARPATGPLPPQGATGLSTCPTTSTIEPRRIAGRFADSIEATDPDLRPFRDSGGKILFWHGGADSGADDPRHGRATTTTLSGGRQPGQRRCIRALLTSPGCEPLPGRSRRDKSDLLAALDAWVVNGRAPGN